MEKKYIFALNNALRLKYISPNHIISDTNIISVSNLANISLCLSLCFQIFCHDILVTLLYVV